MKKALTLLLALLLTAVVAVAFVACGEKNEGSGEVTYVSKYKSEDGFVDITADMVSWEGINSIPIKTANMDITEARKLCVDFFRYAKTALWIPDDTYEYYQGNSIEGGTPFGGLPYVGYATGTVYRLMDYIDEETGVVNMKTAGRLPVVFGNQCANGAYVGFARVINSAKYGITANMVLANGFLRLGDYTYADTLLKYDDAYRTTTIIEENGEDVMYEAYALLKAGDGLVYYTSAGHVIMCASDAVVVRTADGKIDPAQSFITITDQTGSIIPGTSPSGIAYNYEANVDQKTTFMQLLKGSYLPFTFAEWLGTDPIEETEVSFSHTGETITLDQLFSSKVTSNYNIFDSYAQIFDKKGNEVVKIAIRTLNADVREMKFVQFGDTFEIWGDLDALDPKKDYTVKVYTQLGTGERPVLWEGKLEK